MSQTYSPAARATSRLSILPAVGWALMTLLALSFVFVFGFNMPYADEWEFVPALVGQEPVGPWLWTQHNEHRLPLTRAVYYALFQLTHDFRTGMYVQVGLLAGLAAALMALAARLRGRPDWPDLFFPVSLLHIGHWENFLMGYQICFVFFCVLVTALGIVAFRTRRNSIFRSGLLGGILLLLIALTGGVGLAMVPAVVPWLLYLAVVVWRAGSRPRAVLVALLALLPVLYAVLYFDGYERPAHHPPPSDNPLAVGMVTGEVLAMAFGQGVAPAWWLVASVEIVVGLLTLALLFRQALDPGGRPAAAGVVAVMVGLCGLALAIGIGRGAFSTEMGLWSRYALLTWPLAGIVYLVWVHARRRSVPVAFCVIAALAFVPNMVTGMYNAEDIYALDTRIETDARAGHSGREIVDREFPNSRYLGQEERAIQNIPLLRAAGIGAFGEGRRPPGRPAIIHPGWILIIGLAAVVLLAVFLTRWLWHLGKAVQAERARELFRLQHERFEGEVLKVAAATGLPRGLIWQACQITGDALLIRDTLTHEILALVPIAIQFEPVPGSDMADVPAAREPRPATAVFTFARGIWNHAGRVVFNHTPEQAVAAFAPRFRIIHHGHH